MMDDSDTRHTLDGRNLWQWRAEYIELIDRFVEYADHKPTCTQARTGHWHYDKAADSRMVCHEAPCTCGVLIILGVLMPSVTWGIDCPDKPPTLIPPRFLYTDKPLLNEDGTPLTIFGLPVVVDDTVPKTD